MCYKKGLVSCICCLEFLPERTHTCMGFLGCSFVFSSAVTLDSLRFPHQVVLISGTAGCLLNSETHLLVREILHASFAWPFSF